MAVRAQPKATPKTSCAAGRADISVHGRMRQRQFVVSHHARNTAWDLYSDDHSDRWQSEPQHAVDRRRSVNHLDAPINSLSMGTRSAWPPPANCKLSFAADIASHEPSIGTPATCDSVFHLKEAYERHGRSWTKG